MSDFYKAGCGYLQLDDVSFAYLCDPDSAQDAASERGDDPDDLRDRNIKMINDAITDRPKDMVVTMHLCRGNFRSTFVASGGYEPIAETLFNELDIDGYFLEYDNERSGGFEPLRFLPKGKKAVLGLITTKTGTLEKARRNLKRRIDEAARLHRSSSCACRRNAASLRPRKATRSPRTSSGRSSRCCRQSPRKSGGEARSARLPSGQIALRFEGQALSSLGERAGSQTAGS